jgi:uncharacterized protein
MKKSDIVYFYKNTYLNKVENYLLIYNPISQNNVTILNKEATYIFKLINNKRTVQDIYFLAKKLDPTTTIESILKIFNNFFESEIVKTEQPKKQAVGLKKYKKSLSIWMHITNQCNQRCKYCYVWKTPDNMSEALAKKVIKKVLTDGIKHKFEHFIVKFSGGECLLELPKMLKIIHFANDFANKLNVKITYEVLTNGVLMTKKIAKLLKKHNITVGISLDGLEKYHDSQRVFSDGSGTFKYVIKGINNLLEQKVPFGVTITVTSKNIKNMPDLTRYLLKRGISFNFNLFRENPCAQNGLMANIPDLIKYLKKSCQIIYDNPPRYSMLNRMLDMIAFRGKRLLTCGMGHGYLTVMHDGKIASCQMTMGNPIGTIYDNDIIETMIKGNFIRPHNLTVEGKKPCKDCLWKYACCGGCPLLAFYQCGRFDIASAYCAVYKAIIPEILRNEAKRLIIYQSGLAV